MSNRDLGPLERAVYHLVKVGEITALTAPLYRRSLGALVHAGLIARDADGQYQAVRPASPGELKERLPPAAPMGTLVARVPQAMLDALDAQGPNRSEACRAALAKGLEKRHESGTRPAVVLRKTGG